MAAATTTPTKKQSWWPLLWGLAGLLLLPLGPPLNEVFPIDQTLVLLVPAVAACAIVGWKLGARAALAIVWLVFAGWILLQPTGSPGTPYDQMARGWAILLAASFGLVSLWNAALPFFVRAVQIYAAANLPQASFLAPTPEMFRQFLDQQEIFVFFITVFAGSGLIANDRRANALQIYLSKPLTRAEYVFGKLAILTTFLLLVTWVPAFVLLVVQIAFAGNFTFFTGNVYLFPAITVFSFVQVLTIASAMPSNGFPRNASFWRIASASAPSSIPSCDVRCHRS